MSSSIGKDGKLLSHLNHLSAADDAMFDKSYPPYTTSIPTLDQLELSRAKQAMADNFMLAVEQDRLPPRDMVNLPPHYARFKIEPMRFAVENALNPLQFNVIKYILRFDAKNGKEDLLKARRCLDMLIKFNDGDPDWWMKPDSNSSNNQEQPSK